MTRAELTAYRQGYSDAIRSVQWTLQQEARGGRWATEAWDSVMGHVLTVVGRLMLPRDVSTRPEDMP